MDDREQPASGETAGERLVLASGGIDSTTLLALLRSEGTAGRALFVDYGQGPAAAEEAAVHGVCADLGVSCRTVRYAGTRFGEGEIRGRNVFLLHIALLEFRETSGTVLIGIHAGTNYRDCTPEFLDLIERSYAFHTGGAVSIAAPFISWTKRDIFALALDLRAPVIRTHSCELSNVPCGSCFSCLDRVALGLEDHCDCNQPTD